MKKLNLYLLLFFYTNISKSQNLGINKTNPTESLDVNGNINLSGTIKANGVDCLANQVLMKNNTGAMVWGNLADYDMNGAQGYSSGEGGGGGRQYGGSGGYLRVIVR